MIKQSELQKVAHLARLSIAEDELEETTAQINSVLAVIEQMQCVDTKHLEPLAHPLDLTQRLREDEVTETNQREALQAMAPKVHAGLYMVPKVIE